MGQRWRALMGPLGFGEKLLWFGFVGPDRCMVKALSQIPLGPRPETGNGRHRRCPRIGRARRLQGRHDGRTAVDSPGRGGSLPRTGSGRTLLTEAAARFDVPIEPIFRANDESLVQVAAAIGSGKLSATMCYMERIGLRELRQNASRYIARVARGETVEVTQRGRLVARIVPAAPRHLGGSDPSGRRDSGRVARRPS